MIYTVVFTSHGETHSEDGFDGKWLLIPAGTAALAGVGYGGYQGIKKYKSKKARNVA